MTNYFEVLGLPESLVLDDETLKERFHKISAEVHPDAGGEDATRFQLANDAFNVLRQPSRRLLHLLALRGFSEQTTQPPADLIDLFFETSAALKSADDITRRFDSAANALQKALLTRELMQCEERLTHTLQTLTLLETQALAKLPDAALDWPAISKIAHTLSYLTKWKTEIAQRQTRLAEKAFGAL
ncbi:MAG TPA: J domain-containing protein [Chthoniobacterales bacterium]